MLRCPFCEKNDYIEEIIANKCFFQCLRSLQDGCGGFFLHPDFFATNDEQKHRYELHINNLGQKGEHNGYRNYLEQFAQSAFAYAKKTNTPHLQLFDYGSGPNPAFVQLLEEYKRDGGLNANTEILHWDPFFYPDGNFFEHGANIVFCLEVIEHFENPLEGFKGLEKACAQGGLIAIQTGLAPLTFDEFKKWWYKDDVTHVSFYTLQSIEKCAKRVDLVLEAEENGVVFLRKKPIPSLIRKK